MDANKLAKQLKKELTRNTKKTVALALVTLVALWFWAPLASKWIWGDAKKKKARAAAVAAAAEIATEAAAAADANAPAKTVMPEMAWDLLLDHIAKDELMATATLPVNARDPFAMTSAEEEVVAVAAPAPTAPGSAVPPKADPTPESLGLKLEATFVSRQASRAVISGKTYRLGQKVKVATASEGAPADANSAVGTTPLEFELKAIEKLRVVLMRNEKEFSLTLKRNALGENEQLQFSAYPQASTQP